MRGLTWWMRLVGAFYLLLFVMCSIVRAPVQAEGPPDALALVAAGDAMANFAVDTWFTYGLDFLVVGSALFVFSRSPQDARALAWTVIGLEVFRGIGADLYKVARGYELAGLVVWVVIHTVIAVSGSILLTRNRSRPAP